MNLLVDYVLRHDRVLRLLCALVAFGLRVGPHLPRVLIGTAGSCAILGGWCAAMGWWGFCGVFAGLAVLTAGAAPVAAWSTRRLQWCVRELRAMAGGQ